MAETQQSRNPTGKKPASKPHPPALPESTRSCRSLFEAFEDAVFITNLGGKLLDCNSAASRIFGYDPPQLLGFTLAGLLAENDGMGGHELLERTLAGGSLTAESKALRCNGETFPAEISARLVSLDGETRLLVVLRDITASKKAERSILESQRALTTLLGHLPGMVFRCNYDDEWSLTFASGGSFALTGYPASAFIEKKQSYTALVHPEDRELLDKVIRTGLWENGAYQFTYRITTASGELKWVWEQGWGLYTPEGELYAFEGLISDITERRMDEEQLLLQNIALNTAANGILITNRDGTILWVNPAFSTMSGYTAEEVIGSNVNALWTSQVNPYLYKSVWDTVLAGQPWNGELTNRRKDGTLYVEEMTVTPVRQKGGEITHLIAIKNDVTERKQREREQEAIALIASALRTATGWDEITRIIVRQTLQLMDADGAAFFLRGTRSGDLRCELSIGAWSAWTGEKVSAGQSPTDYVLSSGQPYIRDDVRPETEIAPGIRAGGVQTVACVPLLSEFRTIGALWVGRRHPFSTGELGVLNAIGDMAGGAIHRASLHQETVRRVQQLSALHQIDIAISAAPRLDDMLEVFFEQILQHLAADAVDLALYDPETNILKVIAGKGFEKPEIIGVNLDENSCAGQVLSQNRLLSILDIPADWLQNGNDRGALEMGFITYHGSPIVIKNQARGVLEIFHRQRFQPDDDWLNFLDTLTGQVAIGIESALLFDNLQQKNIELEEAYDHTLEGWAHMLEMRDRETEGHTRRVVDLTLRLARELGIAGEQFLHLRRGALMHDIGKMAIPDAILLKEGPLTGEEWEIMRRHPEYAYQILSEIDYLIPALDIPYSHHERWDGSGYPRGLKGEEIPLAARIFALADVWDALRFDRPYHKPLTDEEALEHIRRESGRHFDPQVVKAFLKIMGAD